MEEDAAKSAAGLSAFKSTGNAMRDGFRRFIEKKMQERVQEKLKERQAEDDTFRKEVEMRTAAREKELNDEKDKMVKEHEIRLKTAHEAKEDAEKMAKTVSVESMVSAADSVEMQPTSSVQAQDKPDVPQMSQDALMARLNYMLTQAGLKQMTAEMMRSFD